MTRNTIDRFRESLGGVWGLVEHGSWGAVYLGNIDGELWEIDARYKLRRSGYRVLKVRECWVVCRERDVKMVSGDAEGAISLILELLGQ